ncbi:hypothetical protein DERP_012868, partial [Dermatophagoides pteronyssinus]
MIFVADNFTLCICVCVRFSCKLEVNLSTHAHTLGCFAGGFLPQLIQCVKDLNEKSPEKINQFSV